MTEFRTKADFIRSMKGARPKQIAAAAKELGIYLPKGYIKRIRYLDRKAPLRTKREGPTETVKFIRSASRTKAATKVVAEAAARDIKVTPRYVYKIRAKTSAASAGQGSAERRLRKAIAETGLARAREIFAQVEATFTRRS